MIEFNNFMSFTIQYLLLYTFSKETVLIRITLYDKTVFFGETNFSEFVYCQGRRTVRQFVVAAGFIVL